MCISLYSVVYSYRMIGSSNYVYILYFGYAGHHLTS